MWLLYNKSIYRSKEAGALRYQLVGGPIRVVLVNQWEFFVVLDRSINYSVIKHFMWLLYNKSIYRSKEARALRYQVIGGPTRDVLRYIWAQTR